MFAIEMEEFGQWDQVHWECSARPLSHSKPAFRMYLWTTAKRACCNTVNLLGRATTTLREPIPISLMPDLQDVMTTLLWNCVLPSKRQE